MAEERKLYIIVVTNEYPIKNLRVFLENSIGFTFSDKIALNRKNIKILT